MLKKVALRDKRLAREARKIEPTIAKSRRLFTLGNTRTAVLAVRDLESPKIRKKLDDTLNAWIADLFAQYRKKAREQLAVAEKLEKEGDQRKADSGLKYSKAIKAYNKVAKDFPLKDIANQANRRAGEVLRKMTLTGENPFGK